MLCCVVASKSPFGRLVLVSGPESLFADRAVGALSHQMRSETPDVEISEIEAPRLDQGKLVEITSPSLFSSRRAVVIRELENLPPDLDAELMNLAGAQLPDIAVIVVHGGGPKGKRLLEKLKSAGVEVIECAALKSWELPQFVSAEVKRAGSSIDSGAASALVDAVGHDLQALAAAVTQLISDGDGGPITVDQVRRYFGGRSEVTSFAVADAALAGRTGPAMEQLRWALATGVAPVLITSALASGIRGLGKLVAAAGGQREARSGSRGRRAAVETQVDAFASPRMGSGESCYRAQGDRGGRRRRKGCGRRCRVRARASSPQRVASTSQLAISGDQLRAEHAHRRPTALVN
jgi:DNA polymerase-3 subunit delta